MLSNFNFAAINLRYKFVKWAMCSLFSAHTKLVIEGVLMNALKYGLFVVGSKLQITK